MQLPVTYLASDNIFRQWFFPQSIDSHFQIFPPQTCCLHWVASSEQCPLLRGLSTSIIAASKFWKTSLSFHLRWKLLSAFFCHCYLPVPFLLVVLQYTSNKSILCIKFTLLNSCRSFIFADLTLRGIHITFFLSGRHDSFKEEEIYKGYHTTFIHVKINQIANTRENSATHSNIY